VYNVLRALWLLASRCRRYPAVAPVARQSERALTTQVPRSELPPDSRENRDSEFRVIQSMALTLTLAQVKAHLRPTTTRTVPQPLTISYTSASTFPLAFPNVIAKGFGWPEWGLGVEGVNARFMRWLLECIADGKRVRGVIPMDFYRQTGAGGAEKVNLAEVLVQMNFFS
jgi:hypothetical protein